MTRFTGSEVASEVHTQAGCAAGCERWMVLGDLRDQVELQHEATLRARHCGTKSLQHTRHDVDGRFKNVLKLQSQPPVGIILANLGIRLLIGSAWVLMTQGENRQRRGTKTSMKRTRSVFQSTTSP